MGRARTGILHSIYKAHFYTKVAWLAITLHVVGFALRASTMPNNFINRSFILTVSASIDTYPLQ